MRLPLDFLYEVIIPCPNIEGDQFGMLAIPESPFSTLVSPPVEVFIGRSESCLLLKIISQKGFGFSSFPAVLSADRLEFFIDSKKSFALTEHGVIRSSYHRFYCLPSFEPGDPEALARVILKTRDFREHLLCQGLKFWKHSLGAAEILEIILPLRSLYGYKEGQQYLGFAFRLVIEGIVLSFPFQEKDGFFLEDNPLFWSFLDLEVI